MSTEKKIEQYLHYYIGCEVEYEGILNGKEMGEELKANKHDVFYIPKIQPVKGKKIGILKSIDVDMEGNYRRARIGRKGLQSHWGKANFKPLLSKLEDITEDQWIEIEDALDILPEARGMDMIKDNFLVDTTITRSGWRVVNAALNELRKRSVDCDGLIEAGLAVDKKTLKP